MLFWVQATGGSVMASSNCASSGGKDSFRAYRGGIQNHSRIRKRPSAVQYKLVKLIG